VKQIQPFSTWPKEGDLSMPLKMTRRRAMECAKVIVFIASDAASYVGGESIEVNGGQLML
jgi:NAD(P)-dependent dehydrogenase (short-subunit alcohol dehydrogenase family)